MKLNIKLKNLVRSMSLCCVIALSSSISATSQARGYDSTQISCMAKNAYMEARGEGEKGMLATIFVVLNRTKDNRFPSTPCKVIAQPNQFVWWGKGKTVKEYKKYQEIQNLVSEVCSGKHQDPTFGAIYFNAHHKAPKNTKLTVRIGNHSFFK